MTVEYQETGELPMALYDEYWYRLHGACYDECHSSEIKQMVEDENTPERLEDFIEGLLRDLKEGV